MSAPIPSYVWKQYSPIDKTNNRNQQGRDSTEASQVTGGRPVVSHVTLHQKNGQQVEWYRGNGSEE